MLTSSDTFYTHSQAQEKPQLPSWFITIALTAGLTLAASFIWSGVILVGIGLLCLAFSLISSAIYAHNAGFGAQWGWVIAGQAVGILGTITLLFATHFF